MKLSLKSLLVAVAVVIAAPVHAGVVKVWGERYSLSTINGFYDGLAAHSSTIATGQLNTVDLTGVNLLWAVQPADAYTSAELTTMAAFLAGGGRIAFMGEHGGFAPDENNRINAALTTLGANIQIQNTFVDGGYRTATVADGQILSHALTAGVNSYQYGAFAPLIISGAAEALIRGEDNPSNVMMAYQNIGAGSIFLITDQNVFDGAPNWNNGQYDNATLFENLLTGNTGAPTVNVPEPASLALVALGLLAAGASRRRRA